MIELKLIAGVREAATILYALLKERTPDQSISHREMPTLEEHINYVRSEPYKAWFLIVSKEKDAVVGACYLTDQNELGVAIFKKDQRNGYAREALIELMSMFKGPFLANINPKNNASRSLFEGLGFSHVQDTLRLG